MKATIVIGTMVVLSTLLRFWQEAIKQGGRCAQGNGQ
jgi:hypothetical protein